jgi:hypothetical protein
MHVVQQVEIKKERAIMAKQMGMEEIKPIVTQ